MTIAYRDPLTRGYGRMKGLLLHPFDAGLWLVLAFTAWLANLGDGAGWRGGLGARWEWDWDEAGDFVSDAAVGVREWFTGGIEAVLIGFLLAGGLMVALALLWLGSRGQFLFLDNLVRRRARVAQPWREWAAQGDSLFLWQAGFWLATTVVIGGLTLLTALWCGAAEAAGADDAALFVMAMSAMTAGLALGIAAAIVQFFLGHFVVAIMYRERCGVMAGWRRFTALLRQDPVPFVLVGLFFLGIRVAVGALVILAGLATCCVGLILLDLPYLGAVLLLPVTVSLRYFDLEFLAQFGPDFDLGGRDGEGAGGADRRDDNRPRPEISPPGSNRPGSGPNP